MSFRRSTAPRNGPMMPAVALRAAAILLSSSVATSLAFIRLLLSGTCSAQTSEQVVKSRQKLVTSAPLRSRRGGRAHGVGSLSPSSNSETFIFHLLPFLVAYSNGSE